MVTVTRKMYRLLLVWSLCAATIIVAFARGTTAPVRSPLAPHSSQQKPEMEEVLKIETNLVPLRVAVADQLGNAITELKKLDFNIYEDELSTRLITSAPSRCPQARDSSSIAAAV